MYILKLENQHYPFAICKTEDTFLQAIQEETGLDNIELNAILIPDYGDIDFFTAYGFEDGGEKIILSIELQKVVVY